MINTKNRSQQNGNFELIQEVLFYSYRQNIYFKNFKAIVFFPIHIFRTIRQVYSDARVYYKSV